MPNPRASRTTEEKIAIFRSRFAGLLDAYGTYDIRTGLTHRQVKKPVTDRVIFDHLTGRRPYGVYLLVKDRARALAIDFDVDDASAPVEFVRRARDYAIPCYIEPSKSKGHHHVWVFFNGPVLAVKARSITRHILAEMAMPQTEVFPKHDVLDARTPWGAFIYAPLFGRSVRLGRTLFVRPDSPMRPYSDQWEMLQNVELVDEASLDEIIETNGLVQPASPRRRHETGPAVPPVHPTFGLPPCAQRMLAEGVSQYQRVACFRLAQHLRKAGVPRDAALGVLTVWAAKNRPVDGKRPITPAEIREQTGWAYSKSYRGCGCEEPAVIPYCDSRCPLQRRVCQGQKPTEARSTVPSSDRTSVLHGST